MCDSTVSQQELQSAVEELLVGRERVALCLDFDGTLAPIVLDPDDATLPAETRCHLVALAESPNVDIVVISGRALDDVRSRVDVTGIRYAGNHGLELYGTEGRWVHPEVDRYRPDLERAVDGLERELGSVQGCFIEDKYATLTVHHREASPDEASFAIETVQAVVEEKERLSIVRDEHAIEIRPDIDHHKGDAVEESFDDDSNTLVVYLGDAQTDVDAFRTLATWDDETVHVSVGDQLLASGHYLESPADVEGFLRWLRTEVGDSGE